MARSARTDRMTALDAAFLHLERTGQLLHVGGVHVVEGPLDFERLRHDVAARLPLIPRYTERAVPVPFGLAHPTWEPDPRFNIRHHVLRHALRPPADEAQLVKLVSRLFAQPLERHRPLWELHQIDGFGGDRSVLVSKVHHCMIDGVSGVHLLGVLFDPTPNPPPDPPQEAAPPSQHLPSPAAQLVRAVRENLGEDIGLLQSAGRLVRRPGRALAVLGDAADTLGELLRMVVMPTPATPWNGHVSTLRRVVWTTVTVSEVKAVKNRLGGTLNDVVLATITAALRGYLIERGQTPERVELRAMVPVNVRRAQEAGALGNRVSMMLAPLPVGLFDPLERYRQVRAGMAKAKERGEAARMSQALELLELLPPALQRRLGWLQVQAAPVNTIVTNVPGPGVSLYVQGKRLQTLVPIVPLAQGVGLAFAILSYADALTFGITTDPALVPDGERLAELIGQALDELRMLAGIERSEPRSASVLPERQRRLASTPGRVA
jgi:WS/DGAT/MGAT family acyltransferase